MESTSPEFSHFLNNNSVPENIEAEQQQSITYFSQDDPLSSAFLFGDIDLGLGESMVDREMKAEPGIGNWCEENFGRTNYGKGVEFIKSCAIARTASCPAAANGGEGKAVTLSSATSKKRKADNLTTVTEENPLEKRARADIEKDSTVKDNGNDEATMNNQKEHLKENSKGSEVVKRDYIHVRARRGQATDSHSLAERVRREKISAKMKYLQNLVPGCNKITGKAGMLDEIINYVQSLQRQVEFLSMKLVAITPSLDFGMESFFTKEMFSGCVYNKIPAIEVSALGQGASSSGLEIMGVNAQDIALRRTISAPVYIPETALDSPILNQIQHLVPDPELQNLYNMDLQQGFTGCVMAGHVKLEEM